MPQQQPRARLGGRLSGRALHCRCSGGGRGAAAQRGGHAVRGGRHQKRSGVGQKVEDPCAAPRERTRTRRKPSCASSEPRTAVDGQRGERQRAVGAADAPGVDQCEQLRRSASDQRSLFRTRRAFGGAYRLAQRGAQDRHSQDRHLAQHVHRDVRLGGRGGGRGGRCARQHDDRARLWCAAQRHPARTQRLRRAAPRFPQHTARERSGWRAIRRGARTGARRSTHGAVR